MMYTLEELKNFSEIPSIITVQDLITYLENLEKESLETAKSDQYDLDTCHNV